MSDARRATEQTAGPEAQSAGCRRPWPWVVTAGWYGSGPRLVEGKGAACGGQGRCLCRAGRWKDQLLEVRGGLAGRGVGILQWGGGAAGHTVAALEKGRPQAKPRGLGAEDLESSRAWKGQAGRIWWLKGWILGSGLRREGRAREQELLLEGSGPPRVRGPHGVLVRDVLGLKSGRGG